MKSYISFKYSYLFFFYIIFFFGPVNAFDKVEAKAIIKSFNNLEEKKMAFGGTVIVPNKKSVSKKVYALENLN